MQPLLRSESNYQMTNVENAKPESAAAPGFLRIENKLGVFEFDPKLAVNFPTGLVGFSSVHSFGISDIPSESMAQFRLLQCLDDTTLSFIVLPIEPNASPIDEADVNEACESLGIAKDDLAMLFIITIRSTGQGITLSVNHRAPIMIDTQKRIGRQYVLPNNKYSVQHFIG